MISIDALFGFSLIAFGVALTPGPNMVYAIAFAHSEADGGHDRASRNSVRIAGCRPRSALECC